MFSKTLMLAIVLPIGLFALQVRASDPTTQPTAAVVNDLGTGLDDNGGPPPPPPPPHPNGLDDNKPYRPNGRGHLLQRLMQPMSQQDISEAMIYMKEHSPNRYQALMSLPDGDSNKKNLQELTARNYLNWMRQLNEDPKLYSVILKRIKTEDQIFGLVGELRVATPDKKDSIDSQLREQVSNLIDLGIQERQLRLDQLEKTVKEQQQKLKEDSSRRDALVEERLKTIVSEGMVPSSGPGMRARNAAHQPGDGRPNP